MTYNAGKYDVIIVGAGHAGIEAALASARLGAKTLCLCTCLDGVGNMPCNPSIGGTAKGQLVREIDALGGEMARAADHSCLQFRMLNRGKGPAVFSPRAQNDRMIYRNYMKNALEKCENLRLLQGEASEIHVEGGKVAALSLASGARFETAAVVLATGTFLNGRTLTGDLVRTMGPDGMYAATLLTDSLRALGLEIRRFKTGTPPRIDGKTVDFSKLEPQYGEDDCNGFSFDKTTPPNNKLICHLAYTNAKTHEIVLGSLDRSPLYSGVIEGIGPRYCPSIEDKLVRFADKPRHQLFLEPCGEDTGEIYLQGMSTSLPEDVQSRMINSVVGLENAQLMRAGYAIEYDCINPLCLNSDLSVRSIAGLYAAGQLCGSSGYEEAAGQGLVAGVNARRYVSGQPPFTLRRMDGYLGTLIDDLVTKGTNEPYRMMTSRSEYRLLCRQDNADFRLMEKGLEIGLVPIARVEKMREKYALSEQEMARLAKTVVPCNCTVNAFLERCGTTPIESGAHLDELLRRPQITYQALAEIDPQRPQISSVVAEQVEINIKYAGYIRRQLREVEEQKRLENRPLPSEIDYLSIHLLRIEARQKLQQVRPETLGQASRISGVSPADIGALMVFLSKFERGEEN